MPKYTLDYEITIDHTIVVEAENKEEAMILAEEKLDIFVRHCEQFSESSLLDDWSKVED